MSQEFETCGGCPTPTICSAWGRRSCSAAPVVDLATFRKKRQDAAMVAATGISRSRLTGVRPTQVIVDDVITLDKTPDAPLKPTLKSSTLVYESYFDEID